MTKSSPRNIGEALGSACAQKAARMSGFDAKAAAMFVFSLLKANGPMSGEHLVSLAKDNGYVPHDDRAFGNVFSNLNRKESIKCVGFCNRAKGHGTSGGRIWDVR